MEIWKPVRGWPYEVSDRGRVRRVVGGQGTWANRLVRPQKTTVGYCKVLLSYEGKKVQAYVHHLVAEAFLGPRKSRVRFKNGRQHDSRLVNLSYD